MSTVWLQTLAIVPEGLAKPRIQASGIEAFRQRHVLDPNDEGRIADDADGSVHPFGELVERLHTVFRLRLRNVALHSLDVTLGDSRSQAGQERVGVEPRVPHVEVAHGGELSHRFSV